MERAASSDLSALRAHDALTPDAAAVAVTYRRLAAAIDTAHAAGESYTVGYLARQLRDTHAYLVGAVPLSDSDADPFALSGPLVDPSFA